MKITHGPGIVKRELIDVMIDGKHVQRIMLNGRQLWPDNRQRVQRIIVDTTPLHASPAAEYWTRGMERTAVKSNASQYMRFLLSGRNYHLNTSYGAYPLVTYGQGGVITFQEGNAPVYAEVHGMKELEVKVVLPRANSAHVKGKSTFNIPPNGTVARMFWGKWQKKVCAGCKTVVRSMPSGKVLASLYGQSNGHRCYSQDWAVYRFGAAPVGDAYISVESAPFNTADYYAYLSYPCINTTIKLPIIAVE